MADCFTAGTYSLVRHDYQSKCSIFYGFYGVVSNVGEQTLLAKGNQQINETVRSEIKHQTKTGVIQNAMAAEFSKMRKWEQQYNSRGRPDRECAG